MSEVGKLKKPQMRGLLHAQIKKNLTLAFISVVAAGCYMRFVYGDGQKKAYADFYRTYDIEKEFERQRKRGVFDSCDSN
ncbi:cytochrome c oxidase subunit 6C [Aethina tumida]|uniref:cytochrome c oxidase subunit 6C n=1 Tax=Aethina tumida TaxID=116153 RepID=UPI00096B35EC|nr:cytochrome c oxidase subunit 6C [Aethina tumida]